MVKHEGIVAVGEEVVDSRVYLYLHHFGVRDVSPVYTVILKRRKNKRKKRLKLNSLPLLLSLTLPFSLSSLFLSYLVSGFLRGRHIIINISDVAGDDEHSLFSVYFFRGFDLYHFKKKKKRNKEGKEEDRRRFNKREVEDTMWYGLGETSFGTELSPTA